MAPPVQSLEDFLLTKSRWQRPSSRGEDTNFNRFKFNLLYYQINYLLSLIVNLCLAELGFRIELWTGFRGFRLKALSIRRVFGLIPLVMITICFHAFLRMPNVKIVDRSIYYERLLRPTIMGRLFEKIGMKPSLSYIQYRLMSAPGEPQKFELASQVQIQELRIEVEQPSDIFMSLLNLTALFIFNYLTQIYLLK